MQKYKLLLLAGIALAVSVNVFTGCKKNDDNGASVPTSTGSVDGDYAFDQTLAEKLLDDAQDIADRAATADSGGSGTFKKSGCAIATVAPGSITIDFGSANCLCLDLRNRRGRIIVTYTGNYWDSGSVHTISFSSYYQDENKVEGTKKVTIMGKNMYGEIYSTAHVEAVIIKEDNSTISVNWDRVRTRTQGMMTPLNPWDDVYSLTGSGNITRSGGTVNVAITKPLQIHNNCRWIKYGIITYTLNTGESRALDYGNAAVCDDGAILTTSDGTARVIKLP